MKNLEAHRRQKRKAVPPSMQLPKHGVVAPSAGKPATETGNGQAVVSREERHQMIEIAAYYRAEQRGFSGGSAEQDWLEAEAEIDRALAGPAR